MSDGTCNTYPLRLIREAIIRLIKGDPQWSAFKRGFPHGKAQLKEEELRIRTQVGDKGPEDGDVRMQTLIAESVAKYMLTVRAVVPKPPKPTVQRSIYPTKPKTKIASPSGHQAELKELTSPTPCGWVQGVLKKFVNTDKAPYRIRWNTKPAVEMQVTVQTIRQLVYNYKWCEEQSIFDGIVGREMLWVAKKAGCKEYLRYVKVLAFAKLGSRLYLLAYRDGSTFEIRPEDLDRADARHTKIENGVAVFDDFDAEKSKLITFQQFHINAAQKENVFYPAGKSPFLGSKNHGSDFSPTSSDEKAKGQKQPRNCTRPVFIPGTAPDSTETQPCMDDTEDDLGITTDDNDGEHEEDHNTDVCDAKKKRWRGDCSARQRTRQEQLEQQRCRGERL
jgi:hypothetical protein